MPLYYAWALAGGAHRSMLSLGSTMQQGAWLAVASTRRKYCEGDTVLPESQDAVSRGVL